jgi:hypothetical protein
MSCEKYSGWMTDAALGEPRAGRESELLAHAVECAACREALAQACALHELLDRGVEALVAGEPSPHFATQLRRRIAQEAEPQPSPWIAWAPVIASALALAVILATVVARRPVHNGSNPSVAAALHPISAPPEVVTASAVTPPNVKRMEAKHDTERGGQTRVAATTLPEIIVPKGQLAAALQLSAAINSGRVDGSQLLVAREESEKPLEVKLIEIPPLDSLAPSDAAERSE